MGEEIRTNHAPTPWHVEKYDTSEFSEAHFRIVGPWPACHVARTHGDSLGDQEDAAFIVAAVNSHATLTAEVARLHERLEDNHVFVWDKATDKMLRQEVEPGSVPDGIECRNDTIKLQDENNERLRAANATLTAALEEARGALEWIANPSTGMSHVIFRQAATFKAERALATIKTARGWSDEHGEGEMSEMGMSGFGEAMSKILNESGRWRRREWNRPSHIQTATVVLNGRSVKQVIMIMKNGAINAYTPSQCDMTAIDWMTVP